MAFATDNVQDTMTPRHPLSRAREHRTASSEGRLIVVSNRVADPKSAAKAGGLAVALKDALGELGGVWFGWSGDCSGSDDLRQTVTDGITYATTDLSQEEYGSYYLGYANQVLWPIFHQRLDVANFDEAFRESSFAVNDRFARALAGLAGANDVVWIHDYHLLPLGHALRRLGCGQRMGLFLHTPLPHRQFLITLPQHRDLLRGLLAYDVIGFQTEQDCGNFMDYAVTELGARRHGENQLIAGDRAIMVKAFPIGIDVEEVRGFLEGKAAETDLARIKEGLRGCQQIIGAERLDYSKGLPERFQAIQRLFFDHQELVGRVRLFQVAAPSRSSLGPYRSLRHTLDSLAGSVNGEFGRTDWQPIIYVRRNVARSRLARHFRLSRVGMVTPLRDGMNLVAKEYVAAQDAEDPGVLVLSEFAGAAEQMSAALLVNPHDIPGTAAALHQALTMSRAERQERHAALLDAVERSAINRWRTDFLRLLKAPASAKALT
jgi:trehalose 6-phosphate synthase